MTLEGRLERRMDASSMFGIVQPGSKEAERNLAQQKRVARDRRITELPVWERPDPNRKLPAGIIKAK